MLALLLRLGETDCEALGDGYLAQPVNALSSLAYVAVGLWIALGTRGRGARPQKAAFVFGAALIIVGLGSFAFHGPQFTGSRWLHDWGIAAAVSFIAVWDLALWRGWGFGTLMPVYLGAATGLGLAFLLAPEAGEWLIGLTVATLVVAEVAVYRLGLGPMSASDKRAAGVAAGALILGLALNLLGRTGAPWCDPAIPAQGHAAWHLLTALAAGAYAPVVLARTIPERSPSV